MPASRNDLDDPVGRKYGFMEPAHRGDPGKSWSALQIPCDGCGADVGAYCPGNRFHPERMVKLRELARSGEVVGEVIRDRLKACEDCHRRKNQTGSKWLACDNPEHRCTSMDRGSRCSGAVITGTGKCPKHSV
jgi:hypothetical protein